MFKCVECDNIFEIGEEKNWIEPHGENMSGCPICGGAYEETVRCKKCGSNHLKNELTAGVCDECIDGQKDNIDMCFKISENENVQIELNAFLTSVFDKATIEEILIERLKMAKKISHKLDFTNFIDEDRFWFAERMMEVIKNEK